MHLKSIFNARVGALLWLWKIQVACALSKFDAAHDPAPFHSLQHSNLVYKRDAPSKTTYIAIIVGVVGTITIVTIGVCWDLQRRKKASKLRQMEEARHPREPVSYDHFPVEPGEASEHNPAEPPLGPPFNAVMSVVSAAPLTLPPSGDGASGSIQHPPSFNPAETLHTEVPAYVYEETTASPPPFEVYLHGPGAISGPPGLESYQSSSEGTQITGSHASIRHHMPLSPPSSRPPTASAPPAYSPSDPGSTHTNSAIALEPVSREASSGSHHSLPPPQSSPTVPASQQHS